MTKPISRRLTLGGLLLGSMNIGFGLGSGRAQAQTAVPDVGVCRLFPQAVEGPYYFDPALLRSDIGEGQAGLPMRLGLRVIDMGRCTPIEGARVDVWHANALGVYSGYSQQGDARTVSTIGETYLRGTQVSNASGDVSFGCIYPGWYPGRTAHIHIKVFLDDKTVLTGQLYFPDAFSARIYATQQPYLQRPKPDTTNETDGLFKDGAREGGGVVMLIDESQTPLQASLVIAVDRSGESARYGAGLLGRVRRRIGL